MADHTEVARVILDIERNAANHLLDKLTSILPEAGEECETVGEAVDFIASSMGITL